MSDFLRAEWRDVVAATWPVCEARLVPHCPPGCEIDQLEGSPRISLVAFEFRETRVKGIRIPGHADFPEINLRFYVRRAGERGVVFIRELVPRLMVALVARALYNEPYRSIPMTVEAEELPHGERRVTHRFGDGHASSIAAVVSRESSLPTEDSAAYWLTHHHLGVGVDRKGRARTYEVAHPVWALSPVTLDVKVDFERIYGSEWAWLSEEAPSHTTFAHGSEVTVSEPERPARERP